MERLEEAYDRLARRIDRLDGTVDALGNRLDSRIDAQSDRLDARIEALRHDQATQFRWVVGLIVISMLLPIARSFAPH